MASGRYTVVLDDVAEALASDVGAWEKLAEYIANGGAVLKFVPEKPDPLTTRAESILADMLSTGGVTREQCWPEALRKAERLIEEERRGR